MTAVPTTLTAVAGAVLTAAAWNTNNRDVENFLLAPPICQVFQTVAQSIPNNTDTALTFGSETVDSTGMHSTSSNTDRLVAVYAGWYDTGGVVSWASSGAGNRASKIGVNNIVQNVIDNRSFGVAATISQPNGGLLYFLNVGDFLQFYCAQTSGGALNTGAGTINPTGMAKWVSN